PCVRMPTVRSSPEANCAAPNVAAIATTPKIPLRVYDMAGPSPHGDHDSNVSHARQVLGRVDHITVCTNFFNWRGTVLGPRESCLQPVIPPCPIDRRRRARPW